MQLLGYVCHYIIHVELCVIMTHGFYLFSIPNVEILKKKTF